MASTPVQSTAEVRVGGPKVGGYAWKAPIGSTRPTDGVAALNAAYLDLGYISDDGLSVKTDKSNDKIKDWNLDTIAVIEKSNEATLEVTFDQVTANSCKALFGDSNVTVSSTAPNRVTAISYTGETLPHACWAFLTHDANGDGVFDVGDGQVTGIDGFTFKKDAIVSFKATIELFKDKDGKFFTWHLGAAS
ncbi:phage tail tube protein [Acidipropionibacterium timonense]|uniref:phage tail tube protein n=1 Tax=Acidipropionibacterium timonense TaxID=2161818 RepID=UPI00103208AF|nr:hypothetical protein [Acidipropionibacterium timonense]